jgi:hypothetical protein
MRLNVFLADVFDTLLESWSTSTWSQNLTARLKAANRPPSAGAVTDAPNNDSDKHQIVK